MPFQSSSPLPSLSVVAPIHDFLLDESHGRVPINRSRTPLICGLSGISYSVLQLRERVELLARSLADDMGWSPNSSTQSEWDKMVGYFSVNSIDTLTVYWATHRLGGILTPANAAYSASELEHQLRASRSKCLFTSLPQLKVAIQAADAVGLPRNRIYLIDLPWLASNPDVTSSFRSVNELIARAAKMDPLEPLKWGQNENQNRIAYLCYSSGTSGLPKGVKIAHRNVVANVRQLVTHQAKHRKSLSDPTVTVLGLLPFSHIFGLVIISHASLYRGDSVVVLPKFDPTSFLTAIQKFDIQTLYLVPPIIIFMTKNKPKLDRYNLSSVTLIFTGAAPLGHETVDLLQKQWPRWDILQGYGLTETSTVLTSSLPYDRMSGSSGTLVPGVQARLVSPSTGKDIISYDTPAELWVRSPSNTLGYHQNSDATAESYTLDGYFKTGDEVLVRKSPTTGSEHIFIVDRIKELIKVSGFQVAPAELEAHLLNHPYVNDCAVVPMLDAKCGEVPKAFVVKSPLALTIGKEKKTDTSNDDTAATDALITAAIIKHVQDHKAKYKWLAGGVEFISVIPKSPSGKILRRMLRDKGNKEQKLVILDTQHQLKSKL